MNYPTPEQLAAANESMLTCTFTPAKPIDLEGLSQLIDAVEFNKNVPPGMVVLMNSRDGMIQTIASIVGQTRRAENAEVERDALREKCETLQSACADYKRALNELTSEARYACEESGDRKVKRASIAREALAPPKDEPRREEPTQ